VTYVTTRLHQQLFHTPALSIAVFAATDAMAQTLKQWTEEALESITQQGESNRFFFRSLDPAIASPTEMFLTPLWHNACGDAKTPLLVLDEENGEGIPAQESA
jgi:hypothetical protein